MITMYHMITVSHDHYRILIMSSGTKSSGAENLFACTSCHGKFSFDQLSHGEQLCKVCICQDTIRILNVILLLGVS